jgi:RNA polymerase sigma-70 factor (ECF subfamily)
LKTVKKEDSIDLEEVVLQYYPQISFRVRKSIGFNNPEWEDICSEILMTVVKSIKKDKFRGDSSLGTFIYSITSKKIVDYIRKKTRAERNMAEAKETFTSKQIDPQTRLEKKEKSARIQEAIRKLKPRHADILYLYYYLEIPRAEIAKIYSLSPRWISEIIKTSRKSLKRIIEL